MASFTWTKASSPLAPCVEGALELVGGPNLEWLKPETQCAGRHLRLSQDGCGA